MSNLGTLQDDDEDAISLKKDMEHLRLQVDQHSKVKKSSH